MEMITEMSYGPGNSLVLKIRPCPSCGKPHKLRVNLYAFENWADGVKGIEEAFPELSPAERELLLTGIDQECFPKGEEGGEEEMHGQAQLADNEDPAVPREGPGPVA